MSGTRRLALLWALVLALIGHSIVTQSHIHAGASDAQASLGRTMATAASKISGHSSGECLLCWEKAQAGSYVVPVLAVFAAGSPLLFDIGPSRLAGLACRTHRHGWRSRAPPFRRAA